ncbi:hypothetical protein ACQ4PT_062808 [Festuca glaucescens]
MDSCSLADGSPNMSASTQACASPTRYARSLTERGATVLEPSWFVLDHFDAAEWITVHRKTWKKAMLKRRPEWGRPRQQQSTSTSSDHAIPDFDEGYFDAGQGYRQNYGNFGGPNRQFRGNGRGRGRRNGRGRYNGRGYGGRYPLADPQSQDLQTPTAEQTLQANLQAPMATVTSKNIGNALVNQQVQNVQQVHQGTTVSPNDQLVAAVAAAVESVGTDLSKAKKKKDKISDVLCFKCDTTGHFAADCTAVLCLLCDSAKHVSVDCHLHAMPKPVATMYGLCNDALLFFDIPKSAGVRSKRSSGKEGQIRVQGGELTTNQIIKELNFLVPGDHQWDITRIDNSVFKVVYPTKADYARLRKINDIKVDDTSYTIFFEEWATQEVHVWHLREVWVRVRGCPKTLRDDYLGLFAVGTLIGKTKEVDMSFTREHGIVRD